MAGRDYNDLPPRKTWEFYDAVKEKLGIKFITKIEGGLNQRTAYAWCADPDFSSDIKRNPADRFVKILHKLQEENEFEIAKAGVDILAKEIGCEVILRNENVKPTANLFIEIYEDNQDLQKFHKAIMKKKSIEDVESYGRAAKEEIDETIKKYKDDFNKRKKAKK